LIGIITAIATNTYYRDWHLFTVTSELLNGNEADFETLTPDLLPAEMAWAVTEVRLADDDDPPFEVDVATYVGVILHENGFLTPPPQLNFAVMPERYLGSTTGEEVNQMEVQETHHNIIINEYVKERSEELFAQLQELPWVDDTVMEELASQIRKMNFRNHVIQEPVL
jgi:hypothetical protein